MGRRLALDASVLIAAERARQAPNDWFQPDDGIGLPSIALAEFKGGIACARPESRPRLQRFLDRLLELVAAVSPYDEVALKQHARLIAWTVRHGSPRGQDNLIVAAIAAATRRTILTLDKRAHFDELSGVQAIVLSL